MSYPALTSTTLSAALAGPTATAAAATRLSVASTTGMSAYTNTTPATTLVIGNEAMTVTNVVNSTTVDVERGQAGSSAQPHASGTTVYFGNSTASIGNLSTLAPNVFNLNAAASTLGIPQFTTQAGIKRTDPNTGYEYVLVDCQAALSDGYWCGIDGNGLATALSSTTTGRVGIIVEAIAASDTLSWALVAGTYASALFSTAVTTACVLKAGTNVPDISNSAGGNIIFNARCIALSTSSGTTTNTGTAYINNPWCYGITVDIVP